MFYKKIGVGLVGFGLSGRYFHTPFLLAHPGFLLKKVVTSRSDDVVAFNPSIETVFTVEELLVDDSIDLVFICSPNETHFQYARAALESNKHVVVEKPFALNEQETDLLLSLAKKMGLVATAFQNRRWDADFLTIKQLIATNKLGEILEYEARYDRFSPVINHSLSWKESPNEGHGSLYNLGPHLIDQALQLFGQPQTVFADTRIMRPHSRVVDWFTILLGYTSKQITLKSSLMARHNHLRFILHGTKGSFTKSGLDVQEEQLRQSQLPNTPHWGYEPAANWGLLTRESQSELIESEPGNYSPFYSGLYEAIVNGADPIVKPHEIQQIAHIISLVNQSASEGRSLTY
ncbi:Gfo/Idh/MocA family oxidoreductase (plasmid) [Spirosoma sp. SC4-14]|uniref:Gfo/Idh/MocA family oxidoreductase n=1 Tax=Spirosoma sp. SC4-14 TaxID=3128900 RepID=UPI0030D5F1EB